MEGGGDAAGEQGPVGVAQGELDIEGNARARHDVTLEGIAIMRLNRGIERLRDLARGPGRLAQALRIDRSLDGLDLCREGPLWLACDAHEPGEIGQSVRIGISKDADRLLRFYVRKSPFVSGPASLNG